MKRNATLIKVMVGLLLSLSYGQGGFAYETPLHAKMSELAIAHSIVATDPDLLTSYGLPAYNAGIPLRNWAGQVILVWPGDPIAIEGDQLRMTILNLLRLGAILEDELPMSLDRNPFVIGGTFQGYGLQAAPGTSLRSFNHFFDPRSGNKLFLPLKANVLLSTYTSPDWALEEKGDIPGQHYSYRDAKQYLWQGVTAKTQPLRDEAMGRTFQSLGNVIHHIQDMASPQHARADSHCSSPVCKWANPVLSAILHVPVDIKDDKGSDIYNPSLYEHYTAYLFNKYEQIETAKYSSYPLDDLEKVQSLFRKPRDFWTTSPGAPEKGYGMADFTYRNYVTFGTNFQGFQPQSPNNVIPHPQYPYPNTEGVNDFLSRMTIKELRALYPQYGEDLFRVPLPGSENAPPVVLPDDARMAFVATDVKDSLYPARTKRNSMTSTYSYFDQKLKDPFYRLQRIFSVNSINLLAAYEDLAARSVSYSTLLINYFFRGRIEVTPDKPSDQQKVRLILRNLGKEALTGKFQIYYDAADGTRQPLAGIEKLVTNFQPTKPDDPQDGLAFEFTLPTMRPEPAEQGKYLLVFYGVQGEDSADSGNVTVLARPFHVELPGTGTLYLAGLDKNGNEVHFKVDHNGTQLVSGFDPFAFGLPLTGLKIKPYLTKQTEYTRNGYRVRSVSFSSCANLACRVYSFVALGQNGSLQRVYAVGNSPQVQWTASSPDPTLGDFIFGYTHSPCLSCSPRDSLTWIRYFYDAAGQRQTRQGIIPLPSLTGPDGEAYRFLEYIPDVIGLSADGLTVGDFSFYGKNSFPGDGSVSNTSCSATLKITLGETPTLATEIKCKETVSYPLGRGAEESYQYQDKIIEKVVPCATDEDGKPYVAKAPLVKKRAKYLNTPIVAIPWVVPGYVNGKPIRFEQMQGYKMVGNLTETRYEMGVQRQCPNGWYSVAIDYDNDSYTEITNTYIFSDGTISGRELESFPLDTKTNSSLHYFHEGPGPLPIQDWKRKLIPFESDGVNIIRVLTNNVANVIYAKKKGFYFRNFRIPDETGYVADVSPIGEVFFALQDLSVVVHEPLNMPRVQIPPGVVKLVAALWL